KNVNGQTLYPHMHGDKGWYGHKPDKYQHGALEIYYLSMKPSDRAIVPGPWLQYLDGKNPSYPETVFRQDLERIRLRVSGMRKDTTTPDTRLADDPLKLNPASVDSLIELALGGLPPKNRGKLLLCRLRYFDPVRRRAGLPTDVAALIDRMTDDETTVTLVNTNPVEARSVLVQAGGYAEHEFKRISTADHSRPASGTHLTVRLAPGCGERIVFTMSRFVHQPTLSLPW